MVLFLAVVVAYIPAYFAGFIWDDAVVATENPAFFSTNALLRIWTTKAADLCPLTVTTFWVEHGLWSENPAPYHVITVLLHAAGAVVLWRVLERLRIPGAWLGATLWALHPVQVASVAWIAEMKNTQSGLFYLLAILFFLRSLDVRTRTKQRDYGLTLLFTALAMASKSSTIILPLVLALCAWWTEGRCKWRTIASLWPVVVMAILPVLLTLWTQQPTKPEDLQWTRSFLDRLAASGDVVWFYLSKLIFPYPLMMIYPRWQVDASDMWSWLALIALITGVAVLWRYRNAWARGPFFAAAYFITALLPVLGLIEGTYWKFSFVADHFQYLASMGPLALAGAALNRLPVWIHRPRTEWRSIPAAAVVLLLAALTCVRTTIFADPEAFWNETLAWNPRCWVAENNLGEYLYDHDKIEAALTHYQNAIRINPKYSTGHQNLGMALLKQKQTKEALAEFNTALAIDPRNYAALYGIGNVLVQAGDIAGAIQKFQECLQIDPIDADAHNGLGYALGLVGHSDEAFTQFEQALAIQPDNVSAHVNLGLALFERCQLQPAADHFLRALQLDPKSAEAHNGIGIVLASSGRYSDAIPQVQTAITLDPTTGEYYSNLGGIYLRQGQITEAIELFQRALQLQPNLPDARQNLATAQNLLHKTQVPNPSAP